MNVSDAEAIVSPLGPWQPTARRRSGAAAGFVPVGTRSEKTTRFAPPPNSHETGTGRTGGDEDGVGLPTDGVGAPVELQAATMSDEATRSAAARFRGVMNVA